jgi:predicted nucleic acid-binding Zn ribbon protein
VSDEVRKSGFPEPAGELLHKLLRRRGVLEHVQGGRAVAAWAEAVGASVAADTQAVSFRAGELTVWAREATQAHTLQRMSPKLLEALELALGGKVVRRIRFHSGPRPEPPDDAWRAGHHADPDELTAEELASVVLSDDDRAEVDALVGGIENPEVRSWVRASAEQHVRADRLRMERGWRPCVSCGTLTAPEEPDSLCATCRLQGYGPTATPEERNGVTQRASEPSEPNGGK